MGSCGVVVKMRWWLWWTWTALMEGELAIVEVCMHGGVAIVIGEGGGQLRKGGDGCGVCETGVREESYNRDVWSG